MQRGTIKLVIRKPGMLFTLAMILFFSAPAQNTKVDSALQAINKHPDDSARVEALFAYFRKIFFEKTSREANAALPYANRMMVEAMQSQNPYRIAKAHQSLAYLYFPLRNYPASLMHANAAENEWRLSKNYHGLTEIKYLEAALHLNTNELGKAIQLCEEALIICRDHKLNDLYPDILNYLASLNSRAGRHEQAVVMLKELMKITGHDDIVYTYALVDMGISLKNLKRFDEASAAYDNAMSLAVKNNFTDLFGAILSNKAHVAFAENKLDLAEHLAQEALAYNLKDDVPAWQLDSYELLRTIYEKKKDYRQALLYADKYLALHDTLNDQEKLSQYRELETKYNSELKDKTIAEQNNKIEADRKRNLFLIFSIASIVVIFVLTGSLFYVNRKRKENLFKQNIAESEMKALRAQMNPHFMFNSLNAIQQMVLNNENDNAFHYLDTYSKLTRKILENSEKKWITVADEIKFLELYLSIESLRFQHSFTYEIKMDDEVSVHTDRVPAVVIQPYVENAIKHGLLPQKGEQKLLIAFNRKADDCLEVIVEDNGVGRKYARELKKVPGHQSLGMTITENRLRLLEGKKEIKFLLKTFFQKTVPP